jgi:hypothetical protein
MAFPTSVNNQITDSVTPANVKDAEASPDQLAILSVTPTPIPLSTPAQVITVVAIGLLNGFGVSILTDEDVLLEILSRTAQLTYLPNSSTFTFQTVVFTTAGKYRLQIQNPPVGGVSSIPSAPFELTVASVVARGDKNHPCRS